jgi:hypothetical protein
MALIAGDEPQGVNLILGLEPLGYLKTNESEFSITIQQQKSNSVSRLKFSIKKVFNTIQPKIHIKSS